MGTAPCIGTYRPVQENMAWMEWGPTGSNVPPAEYEKMYYDAPVMQSGMTQTNGSVQLL